MHTARSLPYGGHPDRDPPGTDTLLDRNPSCTEIPWTEIPWTGIPPWTEIPLDRDPPGQRFFLDRDPSFLDRDLPGQRPLLPGQRPPWTEIPLPVNRITDRYKNITFPQLRLPTVKIRNLQCDKGKSVLGNLLYYLPISGIYKYEGTLCVDLRVNGGTTTSRRRGLKTAPDAWWVLSESLLDIKGSI